VSQKTVFIIFDSTGLELPTEITAITDDPVRANEAKSSGKNVMQPDATVAASILHTQPVLYEKMDYATWQTVAEGMSNLQKNLVKTQGETPDSPFFEFTEPDLPASLAEKRLKQLIDFPSPVNLSAQRELTEIIMAAKHQQPVNLELFTEESRSAAGWQQTIDYTPPFALKGQTTQLQSALSYLDMENELTVSRKLSVPVEQAKLTAQTFNSLAENKAMEKAKMATINPKDPDVESFGDAARLIFEPMTYRDMDYGRWQAAAETMGLMIDNYSERLSSEQSPFFTHTPADLPVDIAQKRMQLLVDFKSIANLSSQRELIEIILADTHQQPVNLELFTKESRSEAGWREFLESCDFDDLYEMHRQTDHELSNVRNSNEYRKANGKDVAKEDLREEAQLAQQLAEVGAMGYDEYHLVNTFGIDQDEDGPAPG